jgi:hypothetical protein
METNQITGAVVDAAMRVHSPSERGYVSNRTIRIRPLCSAESPVVST